MAEHSIAVRNLLNDARVDAIDVGAGAGHLILRTGAAPAIGSASAGTILVDFTLPEPCFGASSAGAATANAIGDETGLADGTVGHYEVTDGAGTVLWRGNYGSGELTLNTSTISTGVTVSVTSWTSTQAAGTA